MSTRVRFRVRRTPNHAVRVEAVINDAGTAITLRNVVLEAGIMPDFKDLIGRSYTSRRDLREEVKYRMRSVSELTVMHPPETNVPVALQAHAVLHGFKADMLWQVQIGEWPDSVFVDSEKLIRAISRWKPDHLEEPPNVTGESEDGIWKVIAEHERDLAKERLSFMTRIAHTLTNPHPGFFYACQKQGDRYSYIGFRFGTRPGDYLSGFPGNIRADLIS